MLAEFWVRPAENKKRLMYNHHIALTLMQAGWLLPSIYEFILGKPKNIYSHRACK